MQTKVKVVVLDHGRLHYPDVPLCYAKKGDAGVDLRAAVGEAVYLGPGQRAVIPTGIQMGLPSINNSGFGIEAQIRPRSGLAAKHGLSVTNAPGTIDQGYRGEVCVILENRGESAYLVIPGERIAQVVFSPVFCAQFEVCDDLDETERGAAGFGSTGQ